MRKLKEIINGDFRKDGMVEDTQTWLRRIKILDKVTPEGEDVSINSLDKVLTRMLSKNIVVMQWITLTLIDGENPWYSVSFKLKEDHSWLGSIYGITIYEVYCKAVLFCFAKIKAMEGEQ